MNDKLPPGFEKLTPKILIDMVLAGATARIASGQLTAQDADTPNMRRVALGAFAIPHSRMIFGRYSPPFTD